MTDWDERNEGGVVTVTRARRSGEKMIRVVQLVWTLNSPIRKTLWIFDNTAEIRHSWAENFERLEKAMEGEDE